MQGFSPTLFSKACFCRYFEFEGRNLSLEGVAIDSVAPLGLNIQHLPSGNGKRRLHWTLVGRWRERSTFANRDQRIGWPLPLLLENWNNCRLWPLPPRVIAIFTHPMLWNGPIAVLKSMYVKWQLQKTMLPIFRLQTTCWDFYPINT